MLTPSGVSDKRYSAAELPTDGRITVSPLFKKKICCPYCNEALEQAPKRKRKCPDCNQYIFVRKGRLRTEAQADLEDWLGRVEHLGISGKMFERHRKALLKEWGFEPPRNDVKWRTLNDLITVAQRPQERKPLYLEMVFIAQQEGKNPKPYLMKVARCELLDIKERDGEFFSYKVTIHTCNDELVCQACREMAKRTFSVDEALATMPIPNVCQSEHGCRCWYSGVPDYE